VDRYLNRSLFLRCDENGMRCHGDATAAATRHGDVLRQNVAVVLAGIGADSTS